MGSASAVRAVFGPIAFVPMSAIGFLSDEWFDAYADVVSEIAPSEVGDARFVIETAIDDGAGRVHRHRLVARDGRLQVSRGEGDDADVVIRQPLAVATSIARGELSVQRALLEGRMTIEGDVRVLLEQSDLLSLVAAKLAELAARTKFDPLS
ncbi:MAG: hypothetical protein KatS3mg008_1055 [Acidimicrobiales bacterium]|nr:MAG: hypothetical protein KatS3mg008_1055 [Acidimicrobiales bacterium]